MAQGRSRADLDTDRQFNLALVRLAEIVGEAAARITTETQQRLTSVPWAEVVGLRNRVIHGYDEAEIDEEAIEAYRGTVSLPFAGSATRCRRG